MLLIKKRFNKGETHGYGNTQCVDKVCTLLAIFKFIYNVIIFEFTYKNN